MVGVRIGEGSPSAMLAIVLGVWSRRYGDASDRMVREVGEPHRAVGTGGDVGRPIETWIGVARDRATRRDAADRVAAKIAQNQIHTRRKEMFRATMSPAFFRHERPVWVDQLLSPQSVRATGYFDSAGIDRARQMQAFRSRYSLARFSLDLGLVGVISTQLWHHLYCGGGLADLPTWSPPKQIEHLATNSKIVA